MANKSSSNLKWWILLTVIIGTFLGRLDQTIVNLALPKIMSDFRITVTSAGWIATAYILANAIFVPIWGKLGDTFGQKKIYIVGFSLFIFGSALAGLSWNLNSMIFFRVIQAIASSADYPTAMAIITLTFAPGKERAQALGLWTSSFAAASVVGPLLGGPIIDNFGWRSVFMINIPIGVIGLLMALTFIAESEKDTRFVNFDWWGALTLGISLTSLVLVLDKGLDWGWTSLASLICYLGAAVFMAIFIRIEKRHTDAIVNLDFFKNGVFTNVLANSFIVFMVLMGSVFLVPIFAQVYLGYDATKTGIIFIPMAFMIVLMASIGGRFVDTIKSQYILMISSGVAAVGLYLFSYLDPRSTIWALIIPLAVMAGGLGFGMAQRTDIVASSVQPDQVGSASSVLALVRNIAGAFGVAIFGTILQNSEYKNMLDISKSSFIHVKTPELMHEFIGLMSLKSQIMAYDKVFIIASVLAAFAAATSWWIRTESKNKEAVME